MPSDILRKMLSLIYDIDFDKYKWDEETLNIIFLYKTDELYEPSIKTLMEVFEYGYNIGNCDLTARYLSINNKEALLHHGYNKYLVGTKSSSNGNHAWIETNHYLIDTSLMIMLPLELKSEFGYTTEKVIAKDSSTVLSEYNLFENEKNFRDKDPNGYIESIYQIGSKKVLKKEIK